MRHLLMRVTFADIASRSRDRRATEKRNARKSQLAAISSPEMYIRFRGMSLRYFARVSLNSATYQEGKYVYTIRAEMRGGTDNSRRSSEMYCTAGEVDFSIAR